MRSPAREACGVSGLRVCRAPGRPPSGSVLALVPPVVPRRSPNCSAAPLVPGHVAAPWSDSHLHGVGASGRRALGDRRAGAAAAASCISFVSRIHCLFLFYWDLIFESLPMWGLEHRTPRPPPTPALGAPQSRPWQKMLPTWGPPPPSVALWPCPALPSPKLLASPTPTEQWFLREASPVLGSRVPVPPPPPSRPGSCP